MEFGATPLEQAEGAILAHSIRLTGKALKKGRRLNGEDLAALRSAGFSTIVCARPGDDDIGEDEAANRLAAAVSGDNVTASAAFTGRSNLFARRPGLVVYDPERVHSLNLVDEALTIGVVPPWSAVAQGQMIATLKVIPFAVARTTLTVAEALAANGGPLLQVAPFRRLPVGLIQTRLKGTKESVLDSTRDVSEARLNGLQSAICREVRCNHDETAVVRAIDEVMHADARLLLISGASAVVDRRDVLPAAIERAGGSVTHFGMPVDPGNLLLLARIGDVPVIGLPGCARSPKPNGFDQVLQRFAAGLSVSPEDVMRMGVGGLLKDIPTRPLPRARARRPDTQAKAAPLAREPKIAALILAAGQSRRMGQVNKLLATVGGAAMVRRTAMNIIASKAAPVIAVTGHEADAVLAALGDLDLKVVRNPDYADGLSASLKAGLAAVPTEADGVLVCLGDMPRVSADVVNRLIAAFDPDEGRAICVPTQNGKRGNPVLFGRRFFAEMRRLSGDVGARHLIGRHADMVAEVEMGDDGVLIDIDTPDALSRFRQMAAAGA